MTTKFRMFDTVKVITPPPVFDESFREPKTGEVGIVVMIYDSPTEGYGVEGVDGGHVIWLADFPPEDLELAE